MAGLEAKFLSRANQYGATANTMGEGQVPTGLHMSPLPAVSGNFSIETKELCTNSSATQVSPTRQPVGWATLLPILGRTPRGRKQSTMKTSRSTMGSFNMAESPAPNASLVARLSLASAKAVLTPEKRTNMKSVEATPTSHRSRADSREILQKIGYNTSIVWKRRERGCISGPRGSFILAYARHWWEMR